VPEVAVAGIVIVALNVPAEDAVIVEGVVVKVVVSNFIVIVLDGLKLEPETVIAVPWSPAFGERVIVPGTTTAKSVEAILPVLSLAVITCCPVVAVLGMVTVAENEPAVLAKRLDGVVASVEASNLIVMLAPEPKPTPETVTVDPAPPEVEESVMLVAAAPVTVNVADSVLILSVADMV
jgi:hypothetical protein